MNWGAIGATFLALAVGLGAFGAHGLRDRLDAYNMGVYEKAVFYHFIHALGLVITPVLAKSGLISPAGVSRICWLLVSGILLFSGSLYVLVLTGVRTLGAITPLGGVAFIGAWMMLAWHLVQYSDRSRT
jgi:uncharacterized membrane protein YgdD (TMEM256/DUF423 family)